MTEAHDMRRSARDPDAVRAALQQWLAELVGASNEPEVTDIHGTGATGMSSDTILFTAAWNVDGERPSEDLVARIAPRVEDIPVFPTYDLGRQASVMRTAAELAGIPVPEVRGTDLDGRFLGTPMFVMARIEGDVPPDNLPYTFGDNWVFDASTEGRYRLQASTIQLLTSLHAVDVERFDVPHPPAPLRAHVDDRRSWYEFVAAEGGRSAVVDRAFTWLDDHWPGEAPAVLSWGDARIGNVMYRDFVPVGVLDWEMCGAGPRELDVAWMVQAHRTFQDLAAPFELPGLPDFMRREDVVGAYEAGSGVELRDLEWFMTYAAVQWAIVFLRTGQRAVHFGEREAPADPDEFLYNREPLERMLAGDYWD